MNWIDFQCACCRHLVDELMDLALRTSSFTIQLLLPVCCALLVELNINIFHYFYYFIVSANNFPFSFLLSSKSPISTRNLCLHFVSGRATILFTMISRSKTTQRPTNWYRFISSANHCSSCHQLIHFNIFYQH